MSLTAVETQSLVDVLLHRSFQEILCNHFLLGRIKSLWFPSCFVFLREMEISLAFCDLCTSAQRMTLTDLRADFDIAYYYAVAKQLLTDASF